MKKLGLLIGLALVGLLAYFLLYSKRSKPHGDEVKEPAQAAARYTAGFTGETKQVMEQYYALSEAFVNWDTAAVSQKAVALRQSLGALGLEELKTDTVVFETANSYKTSIGEELDKLSTASDITEKRRVFHTASQYLYDFLRALKYEGGTVYLQECPMAFNDTESASWLSGRPELRNPYLGLRHPKYKGGMLECGETKDSLAFSVKKVN
ncbi:MAG TPA: DUF3347 domain-containing protein [Flavisolibacter sp.]